MQSLIDVLQKLCHQDGAGDLIHSYEIKLTLFLRRGHSTPEFFVNLR